MTMPDVRAKMSGSVRLERRRSRVRIGGARVREEGGMCVRRRDHSSPIITSRARVAANSVRSRVRPACGVDVGLVGVVIVWPETGLYSGLVRVVKLA